MRLKPLTDAQITKMRKDGLGLGTRGSYLPFINVRDFSSSGTSRRVPSEVVEGRAIHCFSDGEYWIVLLLEHESDVIDIREQFPLDREHTIAIAADLQVPHPYYPGGKTPMVITIDFLVTRLVDGAERLEAIDCKDVTGLSNPDQLMRLCIAKETCLRENIPYRLVNKADLPRRRIRNIEWIRGGYQSNEETEPSPGFYELACERLMQGIQREHLSMEPLNAFCDKVDRTYGYEQGTALKVARQALYSRWIEAELDQTELYLAPVASFKVGARTLRLAA